MATVERDTTTNFEAKNVQDPAEKTEGRILTEQLKLVGVSAIVLSHSPGVGGSTLAEMLHEKIEGSILYDGGKEIRKSQGYTSSHTEYMPRDVGIDESIDEIQMGLMRNATPENSVIINSKAGIYFAKKLMHENPSIKIITVLVTCKQRIAVERMKKRTSLELKERFDDLSEAVFNKKITEDEFEYLLDEISEKAENNTIENIIADTKRRNENDRIQFGEVHGILKGVDLHNPGARIIVGYDMDQKTGAPKPRYEKLWMIKHSTSKLNPEQSFESLVDKLVSTGNVKRIRNSKKANKDLKPTDSSESVTGEIAQNGRSIGEPVSKRLSQHPNPYHPSRYKKENLIN